MALKFSGCGLSLTAWCALAILPFLGGGHPQPLPEWPAEAGALALVLLAAIALAGDHRLFARVPALALLCLLLAGCWVLQPAWVAVMFPGLNQAAALVWCAMAVLVVVTRRLQDRLGAELLSVWLARALLVGALVQSLAGCLQLSGAAALIPGFYYDPAHPASNVFGFLGQRNLYAHYLLWGGVAAGYLYAQGRLSRRWLTGSIVWLCLMLAYAASRSVLLYAVAVAVTGVAWHRRCRSEASQRFREVMLLLAGLILITQLMVPWYNQWLAGLTGDQGPVLADSGAVRLLADSDHFSSRRFAEMHKAWLVFLGHPLGGAGWQQFAAQSVALQTSARFAGDGMTAALFVHSHNLVTQLLAEMGLPVTLLLLCGFAWCLLPFFRGQPSFTSVLPVACLAVTLIHSMLEYPLWSVYFLAMFILFAALAPSRCSVPVGRFGHWAGVGTVAALSCLWLLVVPRLHELSELYPVVQAAAPVDPETLETVDRINARRLSRLEALAEQPLYAYPAMLAMNPYLLGRPAGLAAAAGPWLQREASSRPYMPVLLQWAEWQAVAGRPDAARQTLEVALVAYPALRATMRAWLDQDSRNHVVLQPLADRADKAFAELPADVQASELRP